jgi:exopolysaccharide biosynthesis polyprenyl glycosylphosphotransferase
VTGAPAEEGASAMAATEAQAQATTKHPRGWLMRRMLLAADLVGLGLAFVTAEALVGRQSHLGRVGLDSEVMLFALTMPAWAIVAKLYGLYDHDEERTDHSTPEDLVGVFHMVTVGAWLFVGSAWITGLARPNLSKVLLFWALAIVFVTLARAVARAACRRTHAYSQNTIVVGTGKVGQLVARKILHHPEYGLQLLGFVDIDQAEVRCELEEVALLGRPDELPELVRKLEVERVVFAFSAEKHENTLALIRSLNDVDVQVDIVPRLFEIVGPRVGIHSMEGLPLIGLPPLRLARSSRLIKQALDLLLAALALLVLSPFFAVIALLIKLDSPGPIFFRQVRMGVGDRPFRIYKFRTMVAEADERKVDVAHLNKYAADGGDDRMFKIRDDPRTTRMGRFLRRYSLDELPQLLNVLRGEMSLVGPRPLILDEDRCVEEWGRQRLTLKPGITGPWQVLGRNDIPFEEMIKLDYLYVTGWSAYTDLILMLRTFPALVRARDAY